MNVLYIQYLCSSDFNVFPKYLAEYPNPYTTSIKLANTAGTFSLMDYEAGTAEPEVTQKPYTLFLKTKKFQIKKKFV